MNTLNINVIALAVSLAFSAGTMAQGMSKNDYQAGKDKIAAEYKSAKASCGSLSGNANDICVAEAKGREKVGMAELEASYKPTREARYQARIARAEADYAVAKERCDDMAGNTKDICVKEAKAAETAAKADAKAQMKTSDANATAEDKSAKARSDAAADKIDAQYRVAKEKCDAYAGNAKDACLNEAKARFGK
jgi:ribosome-associated translation inhibitor RaiA